MSETTAARISSSTYGVSKMKEQVDSVRFSDTDKRLLVLTAKSQERMRKEEKEIRRNKRIIW